MTNSISGSPLLDTDTLIVNRDGVDYHATRREVIPPICDFEELPEVKMPWEGHNGGIWHIKNATTGLTLIKGPYTAWNIDGTNEREITEVAAGEELVFVTGTSAESLFKSATGNWDFGALTDTSNITNMFQMFWSAQEFNADISNWDVGNVTNMYDMFGKAEKFNLDISGWDVGNVENMVRMFRDALAFNSDIGNWDVDNVTNMTQLFMDATVFNQDLTSWCVTNIGREPSGFRTRSAMPSDGSNDPKWGTCP